MVWVVVVPTEAIKRSCSTAARGKNHFERRTRDKIERTFCRFPLRRHRQGTLARNEHGPFTQLQGSGARGDDDWL